VRLVVRYQLIRLTSALSVALLLFAGLIWMLQLLRLGHHVLGSGLGLGLLGQLLLYSLPTLLVIALPLALAAAILFTLGRLEEGGELLALRSAGLSPLQLGLPPGILSLLAALLAGCLTTSVETPALLHLHRSLGQGAIQALVHGARPGRFQLLQDGTTLYMEHGAQASPAGARLTGLLLAQGEPPKVLVAHRATLGWNAGPDPREPECDRPGRVNLQLTRGEVQMLTEGDRLRRVRFDHMEQTLDLGGALSPHFAFLLRRAATASSRSLTAPAACLSLGLLATVIGLGLSRRLWMAVVGLTGVATMQLGWWSVEALYPGSRGALLLSGAVILGSLTALTRWSRRRG
jgi:hypothetical protein